MSVFVALGVEHTLGMGILSSAVCQILQYFFALSYKRHDLVGGWGVVKVIEHKMRVLIFAKIQYEMFLILKRTE